MNLPNNTRDKILRRSLDLVLEIYNGGPYLFVWIIFRDDILGKNGAEYDNDFFSTWKLIEEFGLTTGTYTLFSGLVTTYDFT